MSSRSVRPSRQPRSQLLSAGFLLVQLLDEAPFEKLRPILEDLIADTERDKQRGAAELLAGVIGGKSQR